MTEHEKWKAFTEGRTCPICGVLYGDHDKHMAWHKESLTDTPIR